MKRLKLQLKIGFLETESNINIHFFFQGKWTIKQPVVSSFTVLKQNQVFLRYNAESVFTVYHYFLFDSCQILISIVLPYTILLLFICSERHDYI